MVLKHDEQAMNLNIGQFIFGIFVNIFTLNEHIFIHRSKIDL